MAVAKDIDKSVCRHARTKGSFQEPLHASSLLEDLRKSLPQQMRFCSAHSTFVLFNCQETPL